MNGHSSPLHVLIANGTEHASVPQNMKVRLGANTPSSLQEEAAPHTTARCVAGVYVESSGQTQSIHAAMKQGLLPTGLGLALLETQAATGGLVNPAQGQLLPVSEALRHGLVGLELKEKLLTAERAVTGYPDPYGDGKLSLFQAIKKEVVDKTLGWSWLEAQLATGGLVDPDRGVRVAPELACQKGLLDQETWHSLMEPESSVDAPGFFDPNTLEQVPYHMLLDRCVRDPSSGLLLLPLKTTFLTLGGAASSAELLEAGILEEEIVQSLQEGTLVVSDVSSRPEVQRYLEGTGGLAGVVLLPEGQKKSFFQASVEYLLPKGPALQLLEAQAATRTLVNPATGQRLWVDEAVRAGLVGPELHEQLLMAEQAVTGYHDPFSSSCIPLFQAMKKELVDQSLALRLLDAQLATGGIICPARRFRLPLEAALRFSCLDEETQQRLSQTAGFSDPSTHDSLHYGQLLARSVTDPETGLAFLPLHRETHGEEPQGPILIEHSTRQALSEVTTSVSSGRFQGRPVSLWEMLFSEAVPMKQRAKLAQQYQEGALAVEELAAQLKATVEQAAAKAKVTFAGLRDTVTPGELLKADIIDQELFEQLERGQASAQDIGSLDSVQRYLQGTGCIAGLLLPDSQQHLSIYEARSKGLLRPGTALILLEAQAATGFIINPKENKRYSVEEALRAGVIGPDVYGKLLAAERAVTGYTDPYTGEQISLFQAMQRDLIVKDHGIRLLEAQIATGGVIDPVHSHRVPVDVAYQRGYFDQMLNSILLDPSDDTKGFFDPNTHENLTYLQLLERCVRDPETGLYLLPLNSTRPQLVDGPTRQAFQNSLLSVRYGRFQGQRVSAWELINSEYFTEAWRRQLLQHYRQHKVTMDRVTQLLEREMRRWADITLPALQGRVTAYQLLEARIISQELLDQVLEGAVSPGALLHMEGVRRYLQGSGAIGGVVLQPSNQRLSLYQAMKKKLLAPGVAMALLEAQAATGAIRDLCSMETLSVDEAVRRGVVGPEVYGRLKRAEDAITGFRDPFSGKRVSLFKAMKKGLVPVEQATRLLEAQVSTGGVIDPTSHHHLPMPVAVQRGCVDQEMEVALSRSPKTFPMPDGRGHTSYAQLLEQCPQDEASGLHFLPLTEDAPAVPTDAQIQETLQASVGTEDGVSLWDLLTSCHFTEQQRRGLLEDVREGNTSVPQLQDTVRSWVHSAKLAQAGIMVPGPRGEVPAIWLRDAGIITQETLGALAQGMQSPAEVVEQPTVKAYLWGTGCVAGVWLQPSGTKVSITQAMRDGLLPMGLGQQLLEAQVASGSLVDPISNQRLSVEGAVKAGLVGRELSEQLRQAERAVVGYSDPYSGGSLSLWQAMEKGLVPQSEGFPLLQVQLATGGVVDPVHGVHVPQSVACRLGLLDEQTSQVLIATEENKFFFDPNAREKVTYQQLRERCVLDADTGLWLLPLPQDTALEVDDHTAVALRAMKVPISMGRFQGHSVSLWDLLHSEYVGSEKRRELVALCSSGRATALRQVVSAITTLVEATESQSPQATFKGLRKQVSARDLFRSQLINKQTLDELTQGKRTVEEVAELDSVRRSLEGGSFIAGVLIQATKEKMSIAEALRRHILRPGTALVLLEAQAATGFIIDPVENRKMTVEQAFQAGMFGKETFVKLLAAERAVTGYTDPNTGEQISLFQAMQRDLIVRDHGIRLLEAQIATGGIIDPVHSHRVPVDVAYQRGYFSEEMNHILADPSDDTKGFFDPNTHENLTYLQLLERCVEDPETGLYMLEIVEKGRPSIHMDDTIRKVLQSRTVQMHIGRFAGQMVSVWDLLSSQYFTAERKRKLMQEYQTQNMGLEKLLEVVTTSVEEMEKQNQVIKVAAIHGDVTAMELFDSGVLDKKTLDELHSGKRGCQDLHRLEHVNIYLEGSGCIAGVTTPLTQEVMCFSEASKKELIPAGFAAQLLEAQAATGFLMDPCTHQRLSVDEAIAAGLVGEELQERLMNAEKAAKGFKDPGSGETIPLFQAMEKKLVKREDALRLLEVQVATGGVIDPLHHHRVPLETAFRRGCLHKDMVMLVADQKHMRRRFVDPNTQEKVTYQELQDRCQKEEDSGWALFPVVKDTKDSEYVDEATKKALEAEQVAVTVGRYRGQRRSVWELLNSEYVTKEKKLELVRIYKKDTKRALDKVVKVILQMIADKEEGGKNLWFRGIRTQVTAAELLNSAVITKQTYTELEEGRITVEQIQRNEDVKRYLEGTSCIAGVLVPVQGEPGRQEKMSIYQAMWKGVLRPGTALVLLEAQAATGFVIDPVHNRRLSVEEAVAAGVVGGEIREKLLAAERAVTGYTDPYSGEQISLFQAMQRDLIVRDHGIRLLEAQIATGGVIDPVHSHRVPVDVAYQRGYFDQEMNQVLADSSDDTKGFFDPNTHENLTYLQLLHRCVRDPDTGLFMLQLAGKGSAVNQLSEELRRALREARVTPGSGDFQGQSISVWELLFYREVPESTRQDLLRRYQAGVLTVQDLSTTLVSQLAQAEDRRPRSDPQRALSVATMEVRVGRLRGHAVPVWDVLTSGYVSVHIREDLLAQLRSGKLALPALTHTLTSIIEEAEETEAARPSLGHASSSQRVPGPGTSGSSLGTVGLEVEAVDVTEAARGQQEGTLRSATMEVGCGQFRGQRVSVWEVLFSSYLSEARRKELLAQHLAGTLGLPELVATLTQIIEESEERLSKVSFPGLRRQVSASELRTSGILDSDTLRDLAQGTKTLQEVKEMDSVKRFLEGTSCIAGVLVPVQGEPGRQEKMSIYQAMWKGVLRPGTALVLLEAQAATGFVIDPVHNRRLSVEEAVAAGVVGGEIREKLLAAERAVTGYTDPYSGEQISLFQAMQRDLIVRDHGIRLLEAQIATGGVIDPVHSHRVPVDVAYQRGYFDQEMNQVLADSSDDTKGFFDPNTHENLTYLQLLHRCVRDPDTGLFMLQLAGKGSAVNQLSEELRRALREARVTPGSGDFQGQSISVWELLFYREVPESTRQDLLRRYQAGVLTVQDLSTTLVSQLAQAEDRRPRSDPQRALSVATMEVRVGRLRGHAVPVWDVLTSGYVSVHIREDLLAQLRSGKLALPALTHTLTSIIEEAEETEAARPSLGHASSSQRVPGPGTSGSSLGTVGLEVEAVDVTEAARGQQEGTLRSATMEVGCGQFRGQRVSVWEVLFSSYLSEARRKELLAQHLAGTLGLPELVATLTQIIEESEERLSKVSFPGLRRQVSASELRTSGILDSDTLRDLAQGTKTLQEVKEMDSVKRFLEGTSCIAGVLVPVQGEPGRQEKMSIYQAMWKGVLRPGTALVLLEAQAATGFVIDPVHNRRLSVEEAVAAGVVGGEIREKLLAAERAVTGYTDPYSGEQISLFQAMQRDLIVRDHGIRLLEAQIATGGVIDPVHSHRVPVDVAYQRGYFDQEMNQVLADSSDDTKGFFDPNTHENLTYLQLLHRCVRDPDTGLFMLQLAGKGSAVNQLSEELRRALREARVTPGSGDFQGQSISVWELLFYREVPESTRQDLLRRYQAGVLTVQDLSTTLVSQLAQAEDRRPRSDPQRALSVATMEVRVGRLRGHAVPVWDVLTSGYVSVHIREDLLAQLRSGKLALPALTHTLTSIIEEAEETEAARPSLGHASSSQRVPGPGTSGSSLGTVGLEVEAVDVTEAARGQQEGTLRSATMEVGCGQFRGQRVSVWEVLFSSYLSEARRKELLAQHLAGTLGLPELVATLTQIIEESEERLSKVSFPGLRRQVSASELRTSGILDSDTLRDLAQGTKTLQEVKEMDSVKRFLEGTSCIAGVLVPVQGEPGRQEKMSIYQAMWKGVLRPGTALVLLEAQAATGFVIDPVHNRRLSVEEAVAAGVVGGEIREKLLAAERAVTGYTDPYSGEQISLFQAMQRDLIVRDHGIRLLEAQIATGGVIDPVHSHRVPVDVAYQRGYFDQEMNQVLADSSDDTKGFFDPNTHENLTYLQLLQRATLEPESGLLFLSVSKV
uniref:epiplakin n=1 Tax=Jaculus jaculus TaxID=51337 RepID=UPI001E1B51CA|nr:epiplakin [Jaculus jaculus]